MRSHVKTIIAAVAIVAAFAPLGSLVIFHMLPAKAMREEAQQGRETRYVAVCCGLTIRGIRKDADVLKVGGKRVYIGGDCSLIPQDIYDTAKSREGWEPWTVTLGRTP